MQYCCSLLNYPLRIVLTDLSAMCVSIITLVAKTVLFTWILVIGETNRLICDVT